VSERLKTISKLKESNSSRAAYIKAKLSVLIPSQIKALRLKSSTPRQGDLAEAAEMKQSRVSAMETPGAVNFNLETLVRVASALKVGLVVKFVSFSEMLQWENAFSQDAFSVQTIDSDFAFQDGTQCHELVTGTVAQSPLSSPIAASTGVSDQFELEPRHVVGGLMLRDGGNTEIPMQYVN